jgi:L-alanine-DL-glutamate epimerase-like enolase superfamily enzyme
MAAGMGEQVIRFDAWPVDVPLTQPFGIAGGVQDVARNVFVRVELEGGAVGHGEAAPLPAFNGETQERVLAALAGARDDVVGSHAGDAGSADAGSGGRSPWGLPGAALCAVEMAVQDALDRRAGRRLFGAEAGSLVTDVTIPIGPIDACADDARRWAARGFRRLKLKVGGAGPDDAIARALAVHAAAPALELLLDGNAGLSAADAVAVLRALAGRGVCPVLFEQPCAADDVAGLLAVAAASDVPVALDESASCEADVLRMESAPGFDARRFVANVKPMKAGFREALRVARRAHAAGMRLMIGGMVETRLAMSASACFVVAQRPRLDFAFVDLDTPLFLADDPVTGGYAQEADRLDLGPITAGHGVTPRAGPAAAAVLRCAR